MHFTDIFIKRPVLATVVSLVILLLGLRAGTELTVREYPELQNAQLNITVAYPGAEADLMDGFITTPIEREVASADGIDFMTSSTSQGLATITANLRLNKDPNEALTEISSKVKKLRSQLPQGSEDPIIEIAEGGGTAAMYMSFYSKVLDSSQITDYLTRIVEPQLASISGIEKALIMGARTYAMRVWLKPDRLSAQNMTASEVYSRIQEQNVLSAVGEMKGNYVRIGLSAQTDLRTPEEFRQLVLKTEGSTVVRLGDVADVVLGAENYDGGAGWDGDPALFIAIEVRPEANVLDVISEIHEIWPGIVAALPEGLDAAIGYDSTEYIRQAISEVQTTLTEAVVIVLVVIFLFLGSVRSALIPAVTVPLSLVGALFIMYAMGYTINLLTLLAMVLAIGMVVDDAIIVMENVHRHIEEGMKPYDAAITGARELVGPVIAMTITLVSVYAPIGFLTGITGKLFSEFAFTLAGAVLISGVVALTLTPMMCARILKPSHGEGAEPNKLADFLDRKFEQWRNAYKTRLHDALDAKHIIAAFGAMILVSCYFLYVSTPTELAPQEDFGFAFSINEVDGYASIEYLEQQFQAAQKITLADPDVDHIFSFSMSNGTATNTGFMGMVMSDWTKRERPTQSILDELQGKLASIPGMRWSGIQPPALPTPGQGYPLEFVIKSTASPETLAQVGDEIVERAIATKKFFFVSPRMHVDKPETQILINRDKAAALGVDMSRLSADIAALLAGGEVNRFSYDSRSYKVIQQIARSERINPQQLEGYYTRAQSGELIPLSTLVKLEDRTVPRTIEHFQQLNSNSIIAVPRPDIPQGEALKIFEDLYAELAPTGFQADYAGASRQFKQEGAALATTFLFALIVIYLVLAAQFESFLDPLIMLVTVPMSICGALLMINVFSVTNNAPGAGTGLLLLIFAMAGLPFVAAKLVKSFWSRVLVWFLLVLASVGVVVLLHVMGVINALWTTNAPGMTLNIYTQVGLVTLIGVISKHGILIVEFANQLQERGMAKVEAIEEAASIRLRPVLMTTAALVIAMVPLLFASGPGAASRFSIGLVLAAGMTIGTLFTLYVVPTMYLYLGRDFAANPKTEMATTDAH